MQDKITIADAPDCLNTNDKAMWVLGYQAALAARSTCQHQIQVPSAAEQAAWQAALPKSDYLEGVNIPNLREALIFLGRESGVGEGEVGDKLAQYVNSVVSGVLSKKAALREAAQAAPAAVAVPALSEEALKRLFDGMHAQHPDKTALFSPFNWFTAGATMAEAALAATPAAAQMAKGYDSGIQTGNRVTLIFETQDAATAWFESFSDAYDAENGTRSITLPIPLPTGQAAAPVDKSPELQGSMVDKTVNLQGAAAAPVALPALTDVQIIDWWKDENGLEDCDMCERDDFIQVVRAIEAKLRALLATATGLPAQAVPLKLIEAINTACGGNEWQGEALAPYLLEAACRAITSLAPQAQAVPDFCHVASLKLKSLQERGYQITGYALEKPVEGEQPERGFINHGGFVGWWWDGQSPQAQADARDAIRELIAKHRAELEHNDYAYFELAYTRRTGWMAWITDKPLNGGPVINPDRKVLARGQGDTAEEACSAAIAAAKGE